MSDYYKLLPPNHARVKTQEQINLFQSTTAELIKRYRVQHERVQGWFELELLSFEPLLERPIEAPQETELLFLLSLARVGLSDEQMMGLLKGLTKPYRYERSAMLFDVERRRWLARQPVMKIDVFGCIQRAREERDVLTLKEIAQEALKALARVAEGAASHESGEQDL